MFADGREMPKRLRKPTEPDGSSPSPRRRESLHVLEPPSTHLQLSPNAAGSAEPASAEPRWAERRASLSLGFGVGSRVAGRVDVPASHEKLRPVVLQVLSTLTLSPDRAVGQFAQSLLTKERGIRADGSKIDGEEAEAMKIYVVVHDFSPTSGTDHLTMNAGDKVAVQSMGQRGWSYGRVIVDRGGAPMPHRAGWFPTAYVKICTDEAPHSNAEEQPTGLVTAVQSSELHPMSGAPGQMLQFRAGEIIAVWQEGGGCWLLGSVVMSADRTLQARSERGWFAAGLTTRFPPPMLIHARPDPCKILHDPALDDYSPFFKPAPYDFPVSPGAAHRRIGDTRQQRDGVSAPAHNKAIHSIMDSQATQSAREDASLSTPALIGKVLMRGKDANERNGSVHENLDLSDSDSDDDLTDLTDTQHTSSHTAGDCLLAQNGIYQRAAEMFPDVYGDRALHSGLAASNGALSASPRYHKNRSLSAIDDVTVHVNITFTHDAFECEEHEVSLRRLAASLITSICRRLTVSERRFKVAKCSGKFSIVLDVLPYYVVSPSEAGAEISASQLGRKIVSLSRIDHGWVATMTPESTVPASGYGIRADVICLEMTAAEAAALREQQMNELSPSTSSQASAKSGKDDRTCFSDPKVFASNPPVGRVASGLEDKSSNSHIPMHAEQAESSSSSLKGHVSTFAALQPPRIALRIVAAENLPTIPDLPWRMSRPFVTLTVLASSTGDVTVCTKPVARRAAARNSSGNDACTKSSQSETARWNEQFVIDVQPDEIYGSKMVIELCERLPSGDDLVVGLVFPPIGLKDLVRAREYNEWMCLVDAETREPLLSTNGAQTRLRLEASFRPTRASTDPSIFDITAEDSRSSPRLPSPRLQSYASLGGGGHDWQAVHDANGRIVGWELAPSGRREIAHVNDGASPRGSRPASIDRSDHVKHSDLRRQSHEVSREPSPWRGSSSRQATPRKIPGGQGTGTGSALVSASPRSADKKRELDVLKASLIRYSIRDSSNNRNSTEKAPMRNVQREKSVSNTAGIPAKARIFAPNANKTGLSSPGNSVDRLYRQRQEEVEKTMGLRDAHATRHGQQPAEQETGNSNRLLSFSSPSFSSFVSAQDDNEKVVLVGRDASSLSAERVEPIKGWAEALAWAGNAERGSIRAQGETAEVKSLLDGGIKPSVPNTASQTALHVAAMWGRNTRVTVDASVRACDKANGTVPKANAVEAVETSPSTLSSAPCSAHVRCAESPRSLQNHAENGRGRRGVAEFERERLARESNGQDDRDAPMQAPERAQERESDKEQERERDRDREGEGSSTCSSDVTRCSTRAPAPPRPPAQGVISHTHTPLSGSLSGSPKPVSQKALSLSNELVEDFLHRTPESSPELSTESEDEVVQVRSRPETATNDAGRRGPGHQQETPRGKEGIGGMPVKMGLLLTAVQDKVEVTRVDHDGSAAREGQVQKGDVIVSVDGVPVQGMSVGDVTSRMRGDKENKGQPVTLVVVRPNAQGTGSTIRVQLPRPPPPRPPPITDGPVLSAAKAIANALSATSPPSPNSVLEQPSQGRILFGSERVQGTHEGPGVQRVNSGILDSSRQMDVHEKAGELGLRERGAGNEETQARNKEPEARRDFDTVCEVRNQQLHRAQLRARSIVGYKPAKG